MANSVRPVAGLTKWLMFWLKFYFCAIALTMISDIWTHFSFWLMADNRTPAGVMALMMGGISVARAEEPSDEPQPAFAQEDSPPRPLTRLWAKVSPVNGTSISVARRMSGS
jgi:hypothetical protein